MKVFLSLKVVLIFKNSADSDEMLHFDAFHLGLRCLPKYQIRVLQYTEGYYDITSAFKFHILVCIDLISLLNKFKYRFYIVPTTQICVQ